MSLKRLNSVAHNFLETYTSRYSDYDGYWIFGHVVENLETEEINLLEPQTDEAKTAKELVRRIAITKFFEQLKKNRVDKFNIETAKLAIKKYKSNEKGMVNGSSTTGYQVNFRLEIITIHGSTYCKNKTVFVAPHPQPNALRSTRRL